MRTAIMRKQPELGNYSNIIKKKNWFNLIETLEHGIRHAL